MQGTGPHFCHSDLVPDGDRARNLSNRRVLLVVMLLVCVADSSAKAARRSDAMAAHLNFGRGCPACHSPHQFTIDPPTSSRGALWGNDVISTYARSGADFRVSSLDRSGTRGMLVCLTCHDGNYAPRGMMRNVVYEPIPSTFGIGYIVPTLTDGGSQYRLRYR